MLLSDQKFLPSCLWKGKYRLEAGVEWNMSLGLGGEEQINVPIAPQLWHVQVGVAAGLLLCALSKVVGASGNTGGENYGWFLKALTVQFEKQPGSEA